MLAGKLDRRIMLTGEAEITGYSGSGAPIYGTPTTLEVWASYMPVSDSEKIAASEVMANLSARFQIRWSDAASAIDPMWTLTFDGNTYDIAGVKEIGRREGIEITAARRGE